MKPEPFRFSFRQTDGELDSLLRAADAADKRGIAAILDPVLDPIHFGFTSSLGRYADLRRRLPAADILMGTGNLTELTDADSARRHRHVARNLLGAVHPQRARRAGQSAYSPHDTRKHDAARRLYVCGAR